MQTSIIKEIEKHTITRLLETAEEFYSKPENVQAFKKWKKSKEAK